VDAGMFNIKETVKEEMRWEAAMTRGEKEVLEGKMERFKVRIAEVSGEGIKGHEREIVVHEQEVKRRQVRVSECRSGIEAIREIQMMISD
jgi:hypothetical protein